MSSHRLASRPTRLTSTVPLKVLTEMIHHPLTDKDIVQFRRDWEAAQAGRSSATVAAREPANA